MGTSHAGSPRRPGVSTRARILALVVALALVASIVVLGEPSRPATATVVRPVVTVHALCTVPTIIDVAAGEPTRGLTGVHDLLGIDEPLVGEAARDVAIVDTAAGTFFVLIRDGELRLAVLGVTGLPVLAPSVDDAPPRTFRAFALGDGLGDLEPLVVGGEDGVFLVFGAADVPVSVFELTTSTVTSPTADLSGSQDAAGPIVAAPTARPGRALAHGGVLWLASDDGSLWAHDPAVDSGQRWTSVAQGLEGPLLAGTEDAVLGVFTTETGASEVRAYADPAADPTLHPVAGAGLAVEATTSASSSDPAFLVRGSDEHAGQAGVVRISADGAVVHWVSGHDLTDPALGLVANAATSTVLTLGSDGPAYHVLDAEGAHAGSFPVEQSVDDRCVAATTWPDAATVISPMSAGSLVHLHDPASQYDCIIDTRQSLTELEERCAPGGDWALDKGEAPEGDFSVEVGRALEEHAAEDRERDEEQRREQAPSGEQQLHDELADVGLATMEVDDDLTAICADEVVESVAAPTLDGLEPVGDRSIRATWSRSGGQCLPERYLVETCVVASDGASCSDHNQVEVGGADTQSNRFATEVAARPDRTYRVTVSARKGRVTSAPSNSLLVTMPASVPAPPTDVTASLSGGVWKVTWVSCLHDGGCEQRPDGFVVTVEGCDGDGLPARSHAVPASERAVTYDLNGSGFPDVDLVGRRVRFRVAASAADHASDSVAAGGCQESVRPGRTLSVGDAPVNVGLSGRTQTMVLEGPSRGAGLTQLFGLSSYDDVSARLIHGNAATATRTGALGSTVSFQVERCSLEGWTVELTPRRRGADLSQHRARITGVPAACDWAVTDSTRPTVNVTGGTASRFNLRVTIPGLGEDVRNGKVDRVTATTTCRLALGGTADTSLSGGSIDRDTVSFEGATPAVFDLAGACTLSPVVVGKDGAKVVPRSAAVDLRPAARGVLDRVAPLAIDALERAMTAEYRDTGRGWRPNARVVVRSEGSGIPCATSAGSSSWTFSVSGGRPNAVACSNGRHTMEFRAGDLSASGRADITYRIGLAGTAEVRQTRRTDVCALPEGERRQPCVEPPPQCPWDPDWTIEDEECVEPPPPCEWDPSIPADDPACVEPPEECEWDPSIPADDPECVEPEDPDPGEPDSG